jgi:hypothetical protein
MCITLKITGFLNFVHRPEFQITRKHNASELDLFPSSDEGRETHTLLDPCEELTSITQSLNPIIEVSS